MGHVPITAYTVGETQVEREPAERQADFFGSQFDYQDGRGSGRHARSRATRSARGRSRFRTGRVLAGVAAVVAAGTLVAAFMIAFTSRGGSTVQLGGNSAADAAATSSGPSAPSRPPAAYCGDRAVIWNPHKTAPKGAIIVPACNDENFNFGREAVYWFVSGTHTLGTGQYSQIDPASGSTFIGARGAVLNGRYQNSYAFGGNGTHITIEYLTIEYFGDGGLGANQQEGVVNQDLSSYWTITHSTINANGGAGTMLGSHNTLSYDCLENNGQYGFNAYTGEPGRPASRSRAPRSAITTPTTGKPGRTAAAALEAASSGMPATSPSPTTTSSAT